MTRLTPNGKSKGWQKHKEMNEDKRLKDKYGNRSPFRMPEEFMDEFCSRVSASLPEPAVERNVREISRWQRLKPYIYMAAMFAGIWCMMKIFTDVSSNRTLSIENPPAHIAALMEADSDAEYQAQIMATMINDEEIAEHYNDIEDLERDFGFELDPEYKNLDITPTDK